MKRTPSYVHVRVLDAGGRDLTAREISEGVQRYISDLLGPGARDITDASESPRYSVPTLDNLTSVT